MKRILFAGALALAAGGQAIAADLPPPVAPPPRAPATYVPAAPVYNWTGIYVGLNGGYNFGTVTPSAGLIGGTPVNPVTGAALGSFSTTGFLVGGTLGGNYEFGNGFVIGVEGDGDYNSLSNTIAGVGGTFKSNWLATARARIGWAWDRVLFYGTGGGAFAPETFGAFSQTTMTGWTVGGGVEAAFAPGWSAKVEYLYVDFDTITPSGAPGSFKDVDNVIRAGVNYKFSW
jgi:outer membrane immunogenic protein